MCALPTGLPQALPALLPPSGASTGASNASLPKAAKPVLEINPAHPLIRALAARMNVQDKGKLEDIVWLLFDEVRLIEGEEPSDAAQFGARLTRVLLDAAGQLPS